MEKELRLKYRWIKQRRKEVLLFLEENYWIEKDTTSKSIIEDDLGITGDDASEMIQKFEQVFHVNMSGMNFTDYFYCEGEGSGLFPIAILLKIFLFFIAIIVLPFSFSTFKEILFYSPYDNGNGGKKPFTVGDLITSSFTHKFTLQREVSIKLI